MNCFFGGRGTNWTATPAVSPKVAGGTLYAPVRVDLFRSELASTYRSGLAPVPRGPPANN